MARATSTAVDEASWITLTPAPGETLRAALARTLRNAIHEGALRGGTQLPSSRALAAQLGVSRGVASDAYEQLEAQGFLIVRPRCAPVVASVRAIRRAQPASPPVMRPPRLDLTPTTPDVMLFPRRQWGAAYQHVLRTAAAAAFDYGDPQGEPTLRDALADHLGRTRGAIADPSQIVVVQGTAQAVDLLLRLLKAQGARRIAVENPSHRRQGERIRALGLELVAQPVDDDGIRVERLQADAVLITPAHQFPTGAVLSGERRRELLAWARHGDRLIAEDDYDAEFRYDGEPVRALQGLDPGRVVQLGTVSKTLAPALRLGWIVVPAELAETARTIKRLLDDSSPRLQQLTLARLLENGEYDRQVRRARAVYRERRDRLRVAFAAYLPELRIGGIAAGMHFLVELPPEIDDAAVAAEAARAGIGVPPLSAFAMAPGVVGSGLVVGYGRLHADAADSAVRELAATIERHRRKL
jgi:GntR family transcriptional regulator / MocR family aminotransferase